MRWSTVITCGAAGLRSTITDPVPGRFVVAGVCATTNEDRQQKRSAGGRNKADRFLKVSIAKVSIEALSSIYSAHKARL